MSPTMVGLLWLGAILAAVVIVSLSSLLLLKGAWSSSQWLYRRLKRRGEG